MADVHRRLAAGNFLKGLSADDFAKQSAVIIGDINYIHPFREGNGRTQLQYLKLLALQAGHGLELLHIDPASWIEASRMSHETNYDAMAATILKAIVH